MKLRKLKFKKIPYYLLLSLLTFGASLIIGFLSFTGMFILMPVLSLSIGSFVLSVAYEGEIYLQNIKGALNKLFFKRDYLKHHLANQYLLHQFTQETKPTKKKGCPQFLIDYEAQLNLLSGFNHKHLDKDSKKRKKQIEKTLRDMEKWFALQLFASDEENQNLTEYESRLRHWLSENGQAEEKALLQQRQTMFTAVKVFSVLAGLFMSLGTTYLLVEAFAALPFLAAISFATLPAIIVPMAIFAGAAYTFLIYNAVTDMINNDSLRIWYSKLRDGRNVFMTISAVILLTLTAALTVCTAGTWWTIAKHTRPLFSWMAKFSNAIASGIVLITGTAQLIFNLQNTSESLKLIENAITTNKSIWRKIRKNFSKGFNALLQNENWLQRINIPRLILTVTFLPLRLVLFLGHLVSIAVSADRVPGVPETFSAMLGFTSEFFEDLHYFLGDLFHNHDHSHDTKSLIKERFGEVHSHDHSADIPTRALKLLFTPLFFLAALWDYAATRIITTSRRLSWEEAWNRQTGQSREKSVFIKATAAQPSQAWKIEHSMLCIDRYIDKHLSQVTLDEYGLAPEKINGLKRLRNELRSMEEPTEKKIKARIRQEITNEIYNKPRHNYPFFQQADKTRTQTFLEKELPKRISAASAA